jgi:hypothetical protein
MMADRQEAEYLEVCTVADLPQDEELHFVDLSQDVEFITDYLGLEPGEFDSYFVRQSINGVGVGDYIEVWGMEGIVPWLTKTVYRVR